MIELGIVSLDTSHPSAFAEVLDDFEDATIGAVWDGQTVRSDEYLASFCDEYDARRVATPADMIGLVDGAMILTVDWEQHAPLATTFLEAGVPTLVDKPLAGNATALQTIEAATGGTPLCGGSAVPFHPELTALPTGGDERTVFAAGYNDFFYYRAHLSDTVRRLAGAPWTAVEPTGDPGTTLRVVFENDVHSLIRYDGTVDDGAFGVLDVTDEGTYAVEIPSGEEHFVRLYEPYLLAFLESIRGNRDDTDVLLDAASLALGVEAALETDGRVESSDPALSDVSMDAERFVASYDPYY